LENELAGRMKKGHGIMSTSTAVYYPEFDDFENMLISILTNSLARRYHLNREDKEDVRQELAVCLFQKKPLFDPETDTERYEEYIRKRLQRQSLQIIKKIRPDILLDDEEAAFSIDTIIESSREHTTESQAVTSVLSEIVYNQLSPEQQEIVNQLSAGFSINEIVRQTGLPYKTVHSRVQKIRSIFSSHGLNAPCAQSR